MDLAKAEKVADLIQQQKKFSEYIDIFKTNYDGKVYAVVHSFHNRNRKSPIERTIELPKEM